MIKPKLSKEDYKTCLTKVLQGKSYKEISEEVGLSVSQLSVKVRELAKELSLEEDLNEALLKQKALRNPSGVIKNLGKNYVATREFKPQVWKQIPRFPGMEVSNQGLVRSTSKILIPSIKEKSFTQYAQVTLFKEGKRHYELIHRLVLEAFNPITDSNQYQVDHINGNGLDNSLSNLRWVTGSENIFHSFSINHHEKLNVCSKGGSKAGVNSTIKARERFQSLLGSRFISYNKSSNSSVTYYCKCCGEVFTDPITSRSFRYEADGICSNCRKKD